MAIKAWEKYSKLSAAFLTTLHKEFTNEDILLENRNTDSLKTGNEDLTPREKSMVFMSGAMSLKDYDYKFSYENIDDLLTNIAQITKKNIMLNV